MNARKDLSNMNDPSKPWLAQFKFWLLLLLSVPSAICSILIFFHLYRQRKNLTTHHHLTVILMILSFVQVTTDIPFAINYFDRGRVTFASDAFCLWWNWWDYSVNSSLIFVMAWGSIDRHVLIFHTSLISTRRKRFYFHLLPMGIACCYPVIFYFVVIVLNTCRDSWDYRMFLCIQPCYITAQVNLGAFDFLFNIVCPVFVIAVANIGLILRVVWHKWLHQAGWRRQRKLTVQLLYIAIMYVLFWLPLTCNGLILNYTSSALAFELQMNYFFSSVYLIPLLMPFISISFLSNFLRTSISGGLEGVAPTMHAV